jgi:two-component system chemotaxis response regulator CheB
VTIVQDLDDALYHGMPGSTLHHVRVDYVLRAADMGMALRRHTGELVETSATAPPSALLRLETSMAARGQGQVHELGAASGFSCPDCQGPLVELETDDTRYRCRAGHAWTADALLNVRAGTLERALWTAMRALEEKVSLARKMRMDALDRGSEQLAERYSRAEQESAAAADVLRGYLLSDPASEHASVDHPP